MHRQMLLKHSIYSRLNDLTEAELERILEFIDFLYHTRLLEEKKTINLEDILEGYRMGVSELKEFEFEKNNTNN